MSASRQLQFEAALLEWINRRLAPPGTIVRRETRLFTGGLIDSIRILELIAWTERATGRIIPDELIRMDNFQSARRIAEVFVAEETSHVQP